MSKGLLLKFITVLFYYEEINKNYPFIIIQFVLYQVLLTFQFEPHHEKTCFLHMRKQRCRSAASLRANSAADQHLCFHYIDCTIPLLPKSEISSLLTFSVAVQPVLCRT